MVSAKRAPVSVVLATFNGERYIEKQLLSLMNQSLQPSELIISDDGSTDRTLEIVETVLQNCDFPYRVFKNPRQVGYGTNFLKAASLAHFDFIAFCDQDDIWELNKIEKCSVYFENINIVMIVHSARLIDSEDNDLGLFDQNIQTTRIHSPRTFDVWGTFWGFSMIFRREIINLVDYNSRFIDYVKPGQLVAHDRWVKFLAQSVGQIATISEPLVRYRQHSNNLFGSSPKKLSPTLSDLRSRSEIYIQATEGMLQAIDHISGKATTLPPLFDHSKSAKLLTAALAQLKGRDRVYRQKSRIIRLNWIFWMFIRGYYFDAHRANVRWRSITRDLKTLFSS